MKSSGSKCKQTGCFSLLAYKRDIYFIPLALRTGLGGAHRDTGGWRDQKKDEAIRMQIKKSTQGNQKATRQRENKR